MCAQSNEKSNEIIKSSWNDYVQSVVKELYTVMFSLISFFQLINGDWCNNFIQTWCLNMGLDSTY